jgi:cytochrome P450
MASGCGWPRAAADVGAVLTSEACRVRPPAEPVPRALAGSAAGSVFGRLVRMNDGDAHAAARRVVGAALASPRPDDVRAASRALARARIGALGLVDEPTRAMDLAFDLPARVMGGLLGLDGSRLDDAVAWTGDFARGIAGAADADRIVRGAKAAAELEGLLTGSLARPTGPPERLGGRRRATRGGPASPVVVANAMGPSAAVRATAASSGTRW